MNYRNVLEFPSKIAWFLYSKLRKVSSVGQNFLGNIVSKVPTFFPSMGVYMLFLFEMNFNSLIYLYEQTIGL